MTIEVCKEYCRNMGWAIAGTESSNQCFCGNVAPTRTEDKSACNAPCSGNSQQICGGEWAMHIYHLLGNFYKTSYYYQKLYHMESNMYT